MRKYDLYIIIKAEIQLFTLKHFLLNKEILSYVSNNFQNKKDYIYISLPFILFSNQFDWELIMLIFVSLSGHYLMNENCNSLMS